MNYLISPVGTMDLLSQQEVSQLQCTTITDIYRLYRNCSLAVLNSGSQTDNSKELLTKYQSFDINVLQQPRGIKLELINPPQHAFVDGEMIKSIQYNMFAVLRDIIYVNIHLNPISTTLIQTKSSSSSDTTTTIFNILRNAKALRPGQDPNLVICWGGHSISESEYQYTREVGNELGLRGLNICTGCGPGAMEGPMKGAAVGHAKQHIHNGRYLGMTEPSIIAAEPPNPIVNELVIMPDIEKRLEAFIRIGHGIIIFPGGPGTAEELLFILGILMNEKNQHQVFPLILTGSKESENYFLALDQFISETLGDAAKKHYQIIIDDPNKVAQIMKHRMGEVKNQRQQSADAYTFNWSIKIEEEFQHPFEPTHQNMAELDLHRDQPPAKLAAQLRRAFSGIVAGNVKEEGIAEIEKHGPYQLSGDPELMKKMDILLQSFVDQGRMKLPGSTYTPCYQIIHQ
ncbi:nucleotide 5'-monophosphate nucleosidase PpnN [Vibrio sp. SS-MA-C1-2]|uniref:nucleotide 5'-monophosphate nucleosidase PpnN n=1 Tax=Vibrio sp. SS-MA-C1-2 TaxID=2908646 RepID=UPI001F463B15|nr:nucleotide 5'-monophosphate nucleosidase PpnN [Vibrio sp. SS-MA-C1-2]UJF18914.1 nucleotide 5'-monophosphate nucleosidase PpnN [Vibrio sp. SS-MA-C1-2]